MPDGARVAVIGFAAFAWDVMLDASKESKNYGKDKRGSNKARPKSWKDPTIPKWVTLGAGSRKRLYGAIRNAPTTTYTVFDLPFYLALKMKPAPSTIFLLSDGKGLEGSRGIDSIERLMKEFDEKKGNPPKIQCVGFDIDERKEDDKKALKHVARIGKGRVAFVMSKDYIRKHGKYKGKFPPQRGVDKNLIDISKNDNPVESWRLFPPKSNPL